MHIHIVIGIFIGDSRKIKIVKMLVVNDANMEARPLFATRPMNSQLRVFYLDLGVAGNFTCEDSNIYDNNLSTCFLVRKKARSFSASPLLLAVVGKFIIFKV